ncbi:DNA repair protein RadA [Candidatus Nitrosacidococcus tergens]|uniref:DNA repair protein RadA n=1 Tax=Candidatus Nitrosacidococcus tergens TaxID=553981 RepID=A0A7G1Q836_9GAMM|nr:DNA repair protein RadA [Candidatus Nitrosacidococcus tergens]CAB1274421.1 repair protein radA homolog [Candidatus Nitrosacidococcus tergens]
MAKKTMVYQCHQCGSETSRWVGQCPGCGAWSTLEELSKVPITRQEHYTNYSGTLSTVQPLSEVQSNTESRLPSGLSELDRVLGGGLVAGSVVLIGGNPGIGKSTLLLQALAAMGIAQQGRVLYLTGEESLAQIHLRAQRLNLSKAPVRLLADTLIERSLAVAEKEQPLVMVVDSIQTLYSEQLQSAPGTVTQVRESAGQLLRYAKKNGVAVILVGHVTKDGALAGPRVLEHMVDTVLYFEGDDGERLRVLRAVKNRFGAVNELGVFAMTEQGLQEVNNPSAIFLARGKEPVPGSAVTVIREGSRPLLVEVQALVDDSHLASPRRVTVGLEPNRLAMLLAIIHRHGAMMPSAQDVFINVVGGVRVNETGADLAILAAIVSSLRDAPLLQDLILFGEVGLTGEIRPVPGGEERLAAAVKHGFKQAILPRANLPKYIPKEVHITPVNRVSEALEVLKN